MSRSVVAENCELPRNRACRAGLHVKLGTLLRVKLLAHSTSKASISNRSSSLSFPPLPTSCFLRVQHQSQPLIYSSFLPL